MRFALICFLAAELVACGCSREPPPPPAGASASAVAVQLPPPTAQALGALRRATGAAERLAGGLSRGAPATDDYLAMRRDIMAARPYFWRRAQMGAEVLLGPLRSSVEGGGMLGQVDAALAGGDHARAGESMQQVVRALRLIDHELTLNHVRPEDAAQALSDAAYDLGLMLLEADPLVPLGGDAVLADVRGTVDGIEAGARALLPAAEAARQPRARAARDALLAALAPIRQQTEGVERSEALGGRAALVRQSGIAGVEARRFASALGRTVRLPYKARYPQADNGIDEIITPFTVPAPRIDARGGDRAAMAAIGRDLFRDKRLSKDSQRGCSDCHRPQRAYSDGLKVPVSLVASAPLVRNTPSLLYAPLHAAQLWDGQLASAESQALKVIHTDAEMGLGSAELVEVVRDGYEARFRAVFDDGVTAANIARALVAFEVDALVPATSPLDRFDRGEPGALTSEMRAGLDVFAGAGRCARCHIPPLFGGSRPRDFAVPVFSVLGVPRAADERAPGGKVLDPDRGRGAVTGRDIDQFAFKTPTVRNVHLTAPFFHNGAFDTLEQVVDFYDQGGGNARGLALPNQDPDVRKLDLGAARKAQLLTFMRGALADRDLPERDDAAVAATR